MRNRKRAGMGKINLANWNKTWHYLKKNGLWAAASAIRERLSQKPWDDYGYEPPAKEELVRQRQHTFHNPVTISLLVPAYNTPNSYLEALLASVQAQTYPHWELIVADASTDTCVQKAVHAFIEKTGEERIRYLRLEKNEGISGNSNQGLEAVRGEYVGLLDHDDLLTPDALYENARRILEAREKGIFLQMLYSDEDKCDEKGESYYEVYWKQDFNLDLLLSNNYICHFLVMKTGLMQKLKFRCNFDGSQDYDLILRGVAEILPKEECIAHIPRVLYHWRCHGGSTAANPQSKNYAYEAGARAVLDFLQTKGICGRVEQTRHLGFFRIAYESSEFQARSDIGILGGRLLDKKGKVTGGIYEADGSCPYAGLPADYSGYMHQAALQQDAWAVDVRCMRVRPELWELFRTITGVKYKENPDTNLFDFRLLSSDTDYPEVSKRLCQEVRKQSYRILWDPKRSQKIE